MKQFLKLAEVIPAGSRKRALLLLLGVCLIVSAVILTTPAAPAVAQSDSLNIAGEILDLQGQGVCDAEVLVFINGLADPVAEVATYCEDGAFIAEIPENGTLESLLLEIDHPHFKAYEWEADAETLTSLNAGHAVHLEPIGLDRNVNAAFWIATATFIVMLLFIALEVFHSTLAALLGVSVVLVTSAVGTFAPDLFIFDFERALGYVDFEVIFLVMGMMIVIAAIEETGVFQWVTFRAYKLSGGRVWLLVTILMSITAVASALLDNVTTMLLMAPLTIQISIALGVNPRSILIPEVLASNVGGIATLIGTPTNILIGSFSGLGFSDFLVNLTPGVLMAQAALITFVILRYRKGWQASGDGGLSPALLSRLEEQGRIKEPVKLRNAGIVFGVMIMGFVLGESIHMVPAVVAITGAVIMLVWVSPDIETMLKLVDWTTLVFFIALFILVGAIQEVGLLSFIAIGISKVVGESLIGALLVLVWSSALLSGIVDNIPFTAAMLPVVGFLSSSVPGAENNVLFYALSVGAAMGGNTTLIGASANMVTAGIAERAGYRITYIDFLKVGLPATLITVSFGSVWLLLHYHIFGG